MKSSWFASGKQPTFWSVVLHISRKQAIDYINRLATVLLWLPQYGDLSLSLSFISLQYAQSDNGRCRAWIRLAVNECSLESYINILCQDTQLLK